MNSILHNNFGMDGERGHGAQSEVSGLARMFALLLLLSGLLLTASNVFAAVVYQGAGNALGGTTSDGSFVPWPAHQINDVALLFVESRGEDVITLSVPNGFVEVASSPQFTGTGTTGTRLTVFWARAISAAMPAPVLIAPSDHFYARIVTFRGVLSTGDPIDATAGGVKAASSNTVSVTGVTTTLASTLVVQAVARHNDSAAAAFSAQTNASLTGIAERLDAGTANGNGGGLGIWAGVKTTAGATGNTTASVTNSINAFVTIALKPDVKPVFQAAGAAVDGPASVNPAWPAHAVNDVALLFVESAGGEAATLSTPAGFVAVASSPQFSGTGTNGTRLTVFWARATSTAMATPRVADAGNHVYARILTYRNVVNTGNPWNASSGGAKATASTSVTVTGVTTALANSLVVQGVARDTDSTAAAFSAQINANLIALAERTDGGTTQQNGGGFAVWDGIKATAGATGDTTATVSNSINAFLTLALSPSTVATVAPTYQALGAAATTSLNWPVHAVNDVALLFVESTGGQPVTLLDAAGFAAVANSPQATGTTTNGTQLSVYWARATSTAMRGPTLGGTTNHIFARILTYRGVITAGNPWDVTGGGVKAAASNSVSVTGITTTVANTLVVQAVARDNDNAAAAFSAQANPNLTAITERTDSGTTTGNGGGFVVWDGGKAVAGATGNTTANVTNSINAFLSIALKPTVAGPDHYELSLPTASIACVAGNVTVTACADTLSPCTKYPGASATTATLTASAGTLASTTVTFDATGVATTSYSYPGTADGATSTITLSAESLAAVNLRQCCPDGAGCAVADSCATTFKTAGFIVSAAADDVAATIPTQVAGITSSTYYLRAVKTSSITKACESALSGTNTVNFAYECNNPTTCYGANLMSVNGGTATTIERNNNGSVSSYTSVDMTFDGNGNAPFTFNYSDVGQVKLLVNKAASGALLTSLSGSSNAFVVAPHHFGFSGITAGTIKAGNNFSATLTAYNGLVTPTATPSFGRETTPESVTLTSTLVTPDPVVYPAASNPALGNNVIAGTEFGAGGMVNDAAGLATVNNLSWDEAGSITLTANLTSGSYLGSTLDATGTSVTVGAFIPDHLDTEVLPTLSVPMPCPGGLTCPVLYDGFVYSGQPFSIKLYARNLLGGTTANYDNTFGLSHDVTLSVWDALGSTTTQNPGTGVLTNNTIAATAFNAGIGISATPFYTFDTSPTIPTDIFFRAVDTVNATVTSLRGTPADSIEGGVKVVSGRVKVANAYGSELLPLTMGATVQLYNTAGSWVVSDTDTVTTIVASNFALAFPVATLAACETALSVTGSSPNFNVNLSAPGTGNNGWTDLSLNLGAVAAGNRCTAVGGAGAASTTANRPWLQFPVGTNPLARGTFGVYGGNNKFIYQRENY